MADRVGSLNLRANRAHSTRLASVLLRSLLCLPLCSALLAAPASAQDLTHKAPPQSKPILITGATIHTVSGDTITGPVYFGEYLSAKFTAKRHKYPQGGAGKIVVPGGPPLAN